MNKTELLNKIEELVFNKDYIPARKLIRNDLKRLGNQFDYYFYMGFASTDADERLKFYEKAKVLEPENLNVVINLANAYDEVEKYDLAVEGYNKALELEPNNALVYNNRGFTYFHKGEFEKALNDYNKALSISPKLQIAEYNKQELIKILETDKKYSELLSKTDTHKDYKYYFNLGIQESKLGNSNEALIAYNKTIELNPEFAPVYMFIGILEFQKENYEKAYEYYTKSIKLDAEMTDAYFNRAQIVFATKTEDKTELEAALTDLKKSVELDKKFVDAYYSMAVIYKNLGDYKSAIEALDKILDIDEQSINARALKKLILKKVIK